ncbi:MAG TPA: hypothetical protein DEB09_03890 [Candidatus Magasanikbacteria bacterium]|nr:hypothetical protein [Candidatus Magasanikbacteria bacterium]
MEVNTPQNHQTEIELVKRAKTDDEAFGILYNQYFPKIYGFVAKRIGQRETAEDIVSVVFTEAFVHLDGYEYKNCSFGAWLYKIATNKLIDHYRKEGKRKSVSIDGEFEIEVIDESADQIVDTDRILSAKTVKVALSEVPAKYQKILSLKFFSELSNNEIAEVLGVSSNNVGVLLYRSLKKFKTHYEKYV